MTLQAHLAHLRELSEAGQAIGLEIPVFEPSDTIDVAVVGEIKRGKSTFLNALMRKKVFPSRVAVCTSAVTVLLDGPKPSVKVTYKAESKRSPEIFEVPDGEAVFETMMGLVAKPFKKRDQSIQGNPEASRLDEVEITYPNIYARDGIRLVDTPGVNDPDAWREEITYTYLRKADAAIMLMDPQAPLSQSEMEFLRDKVQARVKRQLLFVLNRADQVSPTDLEKSLARVRGLLEKFVPDPQIYCVAAKPALDAYLEGREPDAAFQAFEDALDTFLRKGRAGTLLQSRADLLDEAAEAAEHSLIERLVALDLGDAQAQQRMELLERDLQQKEKEVQSLILQIHQWVDSQRFNLINAFRKDFIQLQNAVFENPDGVRAGLSQFRRNLTDNLEEATADLGGRLMERLGSRVETISGEVGLRFRAQRVSVGLSEFQFTETPAVSPRSNDYTGSVFGGIVGGVLLGPLGAAIGAFLGNQFQESMMVEEGPDPHSATAKLRQAIHSYLGQLQGETEAICDRVLASIQASIEPNIERPLSRAIDSRRKQIVESRRDIQNDIAGRNSLRTRLQDELKPVSDYRITIAAFIDDLTREVA